MECGFSNVCVPLAYRSIQAEDRPRIPQITEPVYGVGPRTPLKNLCKSVDEKSSECRSDWRMCFVRVCALFVGVRDLQNARFVQRLA